MSSRRVNGKRRRVLSNGQKRRLLETVDYCCQICHKPINSHLVVKEQDKKTKRTIIINNSDAHHIGPNDHLVIDVDKLKSYKGITIFCKSCHIEFHKNLLIKIKVINEAMRILIERKARGEFEKNVENEPESPNYEGHA